jgi:(S)-sulfolactate dehydrogenase
MKIVIPELMCEAAVRFLQQRFDTLYDPTLVDQPQRFMEVAQDADALIVRKGTRVDVRLLDGCPKLRVVGRLGVGLDNIDVAACQARGIAVIPATNANSQSVAEHVIAAAMLLLRPSFLTSPETIRGEWPRAPRFSDRELGGKLLGLVGFGNIGRQTARLALCLGMRVIAHDPNVPATDQVWGELNVMPRSFEQTLAEADIISIHVPLNPSTRNLMNQQRIAQMKRGAMLIMTSRGGIVNEQALVDALKSGHLGGAHLDVFESEPLRSPSIFEGVPNLLLTPHVAGITQEAEMRTGEMIATKVAEFLEKEADCGGAKRLDRTHSAR